MKIQEGSIISFTPGNRDWTISVKFSDESKRVKIPVMGWALVNTATDDEGGMWTELQPVIPSTAGDGVLEAWESWVNSTGCEVEKMKLEPGNETTWILTYHDWMKR